MTLNLPQHPGLFITGTDTGVGKTLIAGGIAHVLAASGLRVGVFKPIASGCRRGREGLVSSDTEFLAFCANSPMPLSVISPVTFLTPAAPAACEEVENRPVDFEAIAAAYRHICDNTDFVIVEGIGGARVPISDGTDVLDLANEFQLPVLIVSRPDLGTINHTLLTIDAVRAAGLPVAGIIISGYKAYDADIAESTAPDIIAEYGQTNILSIVPWDEQSSVEDCTLGVAVTETLKDFAWHELGNI